MRHHPTQPTQCAPQRVACSLRQAYHHGALRRGLDARKLSVVQRSNNIHSLPHLLAMLVLCRSVWNSVVFNSTGRTRAGLKHKVAKETSMRP